MIFHDVEQNSPEWDALRIGKFTASNFSTLFMGEKTKGYRDLIYRVAYERFTGEKADEGFNSKWTDRGHELEAEAKEWYELETFNKAHNGGFFEYNDWIGSSPDAVVGKDGLFEGKAPKFNTQIGYLLSKKLPDIYFYQVHGQLFTADKLWCDFVAYHPKFKNLILRVNRDKETDKLILEKLSKAIEEVEQILKKLNK